MISLNSFDELIDLGVWGRSLRWYDKADQLHRDNDQPAEVAFQAKETTFRWLQHGKIHREGGPAIFKLMWERGPTGDILFIYRHYQWAQQNGQTRRPDSRGPDSILIRGRPHSDEQRRTRETWATAGGINEDWDREKWTLSGRDEPDTQFHRLSGPAILDHRPPNVSNRTPPDFCYSYRGEGVNPWDLWDRLEPGSPERNDLLRHLMTGQDPRTWRPLDHPFDESDFLDQHQIRAEDVPMFWRLSDRNRYFGDYDVCNGGPPIRYHIPWLFEGIPHEETET